jgi:hypothetical protein
MGFGTKTQGKYCYIIGSKVCEKVIAGTQGAVKRLNKKNEEVYELQYDNLSGYLKSISIKDGMFGKEWLFTLEDNGEKFQLQVPYSSKQAKCILFCLPNIDLNKEIVVSPFSKEVDGKTKSGVFVNQDREGIKWAYTKDHPNGLPQMKKIKVKGVETWDDTDQLEFLEKSIAQIMTVDWSKVETRTQAPVEAIPSSTASSVPDDESDLPF